MNKHRRILLALPLVLGALLGAAKWKQMHPMPTQRDLTERAHLREAKIVELIDGAKSYPILIDAFKKSLNDFYLIDLETPSNFSTGGFTGYVSIPRGDKIRVQKIRNQSPYLAEIYLSASAFPSSYTGKYLRKKGIIEERNFRLHPVTERRLRELIANYQPAR